MARTHLLIVTLGLASACATAQMREERRPKWCEAPEQVIGENGEPLVQLDKDAIAQGLGCLKYAVGSCYARHNTSGIAPLVLTIGPSGGVERAALDGGLEGTSQGDCILDAARRAKFSPFTGPAMTIRYPFVMR